MIYYFSGTGNSFVVAEKIAAQLGETLCNMAEINSRQVCDSEKESHACCGNSQQHSIGLVFPVYAWGMPKVVDAFIHDALPQLMEADCYVYAIMTCGDDMGYADKVLDKQLVRETGHYLNAAFSVCMPNTYVCLPGMDVDPDDVAERKVRKTMEEIPRIASHVKQKEELRLVKRGGMPWVKTYVLRPLFNKTLVTDKFLHHNDQCTGCGVCAKHCPVRNITMQSSSADTPVRPTWNRRCVGCLACYHACPKHAVQFGRMTKKKGQKKGLGIKD